MTDKQQMFHRLVGWLFGATVTIVITVVVGGYIIYLAKYWTERMGDPRIGGMELLVVLGLGLYIGSKCGRDMTRYLDRRADKK